MRFVSHHEIEWGLVHDRVRAVVVSKFHVGNLISPGTRVGSTEDLKVSFNFLVDMFHLTIRLRVIGSREGEVVIKEFAEFFGKGRGEL